MKDETWYTIRFTMDFGDDNPGVIGYICDDNGNSYTGEKVEYANGVNITQINFMRLALADGRTGVHRDVYIDYTRIWDKSLLPQATATYNGGSLDGASGVKDGTVTLKFEGAITAEELAAAVIGIDNGAGVSDITYIDENTATLVISNIEQRTSYILSVPAIGLNASKDFTFFSYDDPKYIARAEFDGKDNYDILYYTVSNTASKITDASVANGVLVGDTDNNSARKNRETVMRFDEAVDLTSKSNIKAEMKFKWNSGNINQDLFYIKDTAGSFVGLKIVDNQLAYKISSANTPIDYTLSEGKTYTVTVTMDFVNSKYSATITDEDGNPANTPVVPFMNKKKSTNIKEIALLNCLPTDGVFPNTDIDYIRLWDGDYGKVEATYGEGIELDNAVIVPVSGNTFKIDTGKAVTDPAGVVLTTAAGADVKAEISENGNTIIVTPSADFAYNTKYKLTIPANLTLSGEAQTVIFTTIYNNGNTFDRETAVDALGTDAPKVVFFGGSITEQENGWRSVVSDQITAWFPNATCINSSIGGTGAEYGWMRLERDVISKNPDLVFVEFAVNDSSNPKAADNMESVIRNLNKMEKPPVIIMVYTTMRGFEANEWAISEQERIADAYGIPSINIRDYARSKYNESTEFAAKWDADGSENYLQDGTHPAPAGATLYGEYVNSLLTYHTAEYFKTPESNSDVDVVTSGYKDYTYEYQTIDTVLDTDGATKEFKFSGTEAVLEIAYTWDVGGKYTVTIDGNVVTSDGNALRKSGLPSRNFLRYDNLSDEEHTVVVTVAGKDDISKGYEVGMNGIFVLSAAPASFIKPAFDASEVTPGSSLKATASYTSGTVTPYVFIIALYDTDGRFTGLEKVESETDASGMAQPVEVTVTPATGDAKAKAFIWSSVDSLIPFTEAAKLGF